MTKPRLTPSVSGPIHYLGPLLSRAPFRPRSFCLRVSGAVAPSAPRLSARPLLRACKQRRRFSTIPPHGQAVPIYNGKGDRESGAVIRLLSTAAEMLVKVHDLGALLKAEQDVEVGAPAAAERNGLLDMVRNTGASLGALEKDAHREWPLADYRLIGSGDSDEIGKIYDISLRCRASF